MAGQRSCQPLYKINSKILITMFIFLVNPCFPCITPIHLLIHDSFQFSNTPYSPYYCPSLQSMFTVESSLCTIVPAKCLLRSKNYIRDSVIFCSITYYYFFQYTFQKMTFLSIKCHFMQTLPYFLSLFVILLSYKSRKNLSALPAFVSSLLLVCFVYAHFFLGRKLRLPLKLYKK